MTDQTRHHRGKTAHLAGAAAEDIVTRHYLEFGAQLLDTRWRGEAGEIDLIFRLKGAFVFVEVKAGPDHATAAGRISTAQATRIQHAALEYLAAQGLGPDTDMRFDAALVDAVGRVERLENVFM